MRIGIAAELANGEIQTGVERYAKQLILQLASIDSVNQYTLYLRREPREWLRRLPESFEFKVLPFPGAWTKMRLSQELRRDRVDVLFALNHRLPLVHPPRTVLTVHDASFLRCPEFETRIARRYLPWSYRRLIKRAWRVIAVSQSTADDILTLAPLAAKRIRVIHHGYERSDLNEGPPTPASPAGLPDRYVLFLSTIQPRKNLPRLIDAFVTLRRLNPTLPHRLVVAGPLGWNYEPLVAKIRAHPDDVVYLGYVDDATRWPLYRCADLFVLPSLCEGFGLGVLEAFDAGTPVAVSRAASLPEVAGDAALYFDPESEAEIASAIQRALTDMALREVLVARGRRRLAEFSWERCARETLAVLTGER
jgi:glycosyltransferase involved in cell wall biosynthesis